MKTKNLIQFFNKTFELTTLGKLRRWRTFRKKRWSLGVGDKKNTKKGMREISRIKNCEH